MMITNSAIEREFQITFAHVNGSETPFSRAHYPTVQTCCECPMARPLYEDRFSCGNNLAKVVRSRFPATAECHDAVENAPERYFHPLPLPDLQGLEPEWVCDRIHLNLNWLDVIDDAPAAKDGEIVIEVCHHDLRIGYLRRDAALYYSNRLASFRSDDPYWLALHMIHPDYLDRIVDEIIEERLSVPDYF